MADTTVIGFHLPTEEHGCMSNWYPAEFTYAGLRFLSVQQYMMYHKVMLAGRYDLAKEIMNSDDPAVLEKLAGDGTFPEFTRIKNKWHWICRIVVRRAVFAKFMQHPDLRRELLSTGNALLAECSHLDKTWGVGISLRDMRWKSPENWNGKNDLGNILMEVRDEIRQLEMAFGEDNLRFEDALHAEANDEWKMSAAALANHPSYGRSVMAYVDTFANNFTRQSFMDASTSLADWEKKIRDKEGAAVPVLGFFDLKQDVYDTARSLQMQDDKRQRRLEFCEKYIPVLQMIEDDPELIAACREHSIYRLDAKHGSLIDFLYHFFMEEAYQKDIVVHNYSNLVEAAGMNDKVAAPTEEDLGGLSSEQLLGCIAWHFRRDHFDNGSLISNSIAQGHMLRMLKVYVDKETKNC
jgi:ribA/ribD-fused uncharacterized protein